MLNYIRAEFYKVLRRSYTWVTLGVALGLEVPLMTVQMLIGIGGSPMSFSYGVTNLIILLGLGFYAAPLTGDMVFAGQYRHGTLKNEVSFGLSRARIYGGKLLTQTALSLMLGVVLVGLYVRFCALSLSHDPQADAEALRTVGYCLATALPLWIGGQAAACAMLFLIPSGTGAVLAALGIFTVLPPACYVTSLILSGSHGSLAGDALMAVYRNMPTVLLNTAVGRPVDWAFCGRAWLVGAAWFAGFTAIGLLGFQRKELK